jgi:hypothetical protein
LIIHSRSHGTLMIGLAPDEATKLDSCVFSSIPWVYCCLTYCIIIRICNLTMLSIDQSPIEASSSENSLADRRRVESVLRQPWSFKGWRNGHVRQPKADSGLLVGESGLEGGGGLHLYPEVYMIYGIVSRLDSRGREEAISARHGRVIIMPSRDGPIC